MKLSKIYIKIFLVVMLVLVGSVAPIVTHADGLTFTVNSTDDSSDANIGDGICDAGEGACTLRAAIEESNVGSGSDTIDFSLAPNSTITMTGGSYNIYTPIVIDATAAGVFSPTPDITISGGSNVIFNLGVGADGTSIKGFRLTYASTGMGISINDISGDTTTISANIIGLNASDGASGGAVGIDIRNSSNIVIGGASADDRNVISGNQTEESSSGIQISEESSDILIQYNYFGTNAAGTAVVSNSGEDIDIWNGDLDTGLISNVTISHNLFTGGYDGVSTTSAQVTNLTISANTFGLHADGQTLLDLSAFSQPKSISVNDTIFAGVTIGGDNPSDGNIFTQASAMRPVIGGLSGSGSGLTIKNNTISSAGDPGLTAVLLAIGNIADVVISNNTITNFTYGIALVNPNSVNPAMVRENDISQTNTGILVETIVGAGETSYASILQNNITETTIGIDLATDSDVNILPDTNTGPTANDAGDGDTGPNDYLNTPVINAVNTTTGVVTYTMDVPAGMYRIEFFKNPTSGTYGSGEEYVGYATFESTGTEATTTTTLIGLTTGDFITATATQVTGENTYLATSEFSQAYVALPEPEPEPEPQQVITVISVGRSRGYTPPTTPNNSSVAPADILGSGTCPAELIITDSMKQGDRNGKYSAYNKRVVKDVKILQAHINRILAAQYNQAAGPVDGIFGKQTKRGVERLQTALNTILKPTPLLKIDGIVGSYTKNAINNSCGGM